jgi:hypothetical protein
MSFHPLVRVLAVCGSLVLAPAVVVAQEVCPDGYPIDCGTGTCCPVGHYCVPGGCVPDGWSDCGNGLICPPGKNIHCPRVQGCYSNYEAAGADGCSFEETTVCGVPVQ